MSSQPTSMMECNKAFDHCSIAGWFRKPSFFAQGDVNLHEFSSERDAGDVFRPAEAMPGAEDFRCVKRMGRNVARIGGKDLPFHLHIFFKWVVQTPTSCFSIFRILD